MLPMGQNQSLRSLASLAIFNLNSQGHPLLGPRMEDCAANSLHLYLLPPRAPGLWDVLSEARVPKGKIKFTVF